MIDFGEFQPFKDAEMIRPSITILSKSEPSGDMHLFRWLTAGHPPEGLSDEIATAPTVNHSRLKGQTWELEPDSVINLRDKLKANGHALRGYGPRVIYGDTNIYRGVLSGLTEAYVIDQMTRDKLVEGDPTCERLVRPFVQGTHLRPWYIEDSGQYLIALRSSANWQWPWSKELLNAEEIFRKTFPTLFEHLNQFREAAKKRTDQGTFWWELRSCDYWDEFDRAKITWPDISKLPRFSMDKEGRNMGNTGYFIPSSDYYLLGVLSSWACWFFISKTFQPLRLRGDRWQYRLFSQSMENIPIPDPVEVDRNAIGNLALTCSTKARERYQLQLSFQRRLIQVFAEGGVGQLNQKAEGWWELSLNQLGDALKQSFKLEKNPMRNPKTADEWEGYLREKTDENARLTRSLADAEAELNDRVYRLFHLTPDEVRLLQKEVEH